MKTRVMLLIQHLTDGGAERVVTLWAQFLANQGYEVTVLTNYPLPNEYPLDPRVTRVNLTTNYQQYSKLLHKPTTCKKKLKHYLSQHPQDILIPFLTNSNIFAGLFQHKKLKLTTQVIRNNPWREKKNFNLILRDWAIQKQGSVILQNDEQMEYFNTEAFQHVKKYIVHNPLNPEIANIKKSHYGPIKKIVAVGRLAPQKNHALMIEAIRILRDEFHEIYHLDIYGVGILHDDLQAKIDQAGLGDQIRLCGRSQNIFRTLIDYDLFLLTSSYEGTPNALLEAMGLGLPSLAIKCRTGITELIEDGKNGYLLDTSDAHALASKIRQINKPEQLAKIGRQARTDMTRYAPEKIQAELVTVIEDLLANPPRLTNIPIETALQQFKLQNASDYQSYLESSLYLIKMSNYSIGKQIFKHARRTLKNVDITTSTGTKTKYLNCLRSNRFYRFYRHLQKDSPSHFNS